MTCHNRKPQTLACLESLRVAALSARQRCTLHVFLVDDGCTDGTAAAVRERFSEVTIVEGTGSLYWCGGMRRAWQAADTAGAFDGFLWLNDDVVLSPTSLSLLLDTADVIIRGTGRVGIVVGATQDPASGCTSYGEMGPEGVRPATTVAHPIDSFNGNIVLVPRQVYSAVGNLSGAYRHGFGDIDYAWRARQLDIPLWVAPGHLGSCSIDKVSRWERPELSVWQRLIALHMPTGCPPWEVITLMVTCGNWWFPITIAKLYWRALFPQGRHAPPMNSD